MWIVFWIQRVTFGDSVASGHLLRKEPWLWLGAGCRQHGGESMGTLMDIRRKPGRRRADGELVWPVCCPVLRCLSCPGIFNTGSCHFWTSPCDMYTIPPSHGRPASGHWGASSLTWVHGWQLMQWLLPGSKANSTAVKWVTVGKPYQKTRPLGSKYQECWILAVTYQVLFFHTLSSSWDETCQLALKKYFREPWSLYVFALGTAEFKKLKIKIWKYLFSPHGLGF